MSETEEPITITLSSKVFRCLHI